MNNTILLVVLSLVVGGNCYFQLTRYGSKPGCDAEINHIILETPLDDCAVQGCRRNGWNENKTEYYTISCGESQRSFDQALFQYGTGRNFSLYWLYASNDCNYPLTIEAQAVDSCEGAEHYSCQNRSSKKCLYIQPQSTPSVAAPSTNPSVTYQAPKESSGGFFSTFEQAVVGFGVSGWLLVLLLAVIVYKLRMDKQKALSGYAPLPQAEEKNVFGIFFDLEQPKEVKPVVPIAAAPAPVIEIPKPPQVQEEKPNMLRIPATELNINNKKKLGSGQASEVYEGRWRQKHVAVKIPRDKDASTKVIKELAVLMEIEPHPNIIEVFGYFEQEQKICVVLELCNGANLEKFVANSKEELSSSARLSIAMGIAAGMMHLHHAKRQVIHRDLKPSNILLSKIGSRYIPKIADFDYSRLLVSSSGVTYSTPDIAYAAPESLAATLADKKEFSVKSDVWAYGATLFFLLTGQPPFGARATLKSHRLNKQITVRFDLLEKLPQDPLTLLMVDIARQCLEDDPKKRPTFDQIDESFQAFFNNFPRNNNNL